MRGRLPPGRRIPSRVICSQAAKSSHEAQVTANGETLGPAQRSHVLSADLSYDINKYLTVGGKYGVRLGEVSATRAASDFTPSGAQLAVIRADMHVMKAWDVLVEGRMLGTFETETVRYGSLVALYHHFGDHMKLGAGFNSAFLRRSDRPHL